MKKHNTNVNKCTKFKEKKDALPVLQEIDRPPLQNLWDHGLHLYNLHSPKGECDVHLLFDELHVLVFLFHGFNQGRPQVFQVILSVAFRMIWYMVDLTSFCFFRKTFLRTTIPIIIISSSPVDTMIIHLLPSWSPVDTNLITIQLDVVLICSSPSCTLCWLSIPHIQYHHQALWGRDVCWQVQQQQNQTHVFQGRLSQKYFLCQLVQNLFFHISGYM